MKSWLLALALTLAGLGAAHAQIVEPLRPYDPPVARVAGRAELYLPPDQARVSVSFYNPGRTAAEVSAAVGERARALDAALRAIGSGAVRLERTDISVAPVMRAGGDRRPDRITGYEATAAATILVDDLELLGRVMEAAMNAQPDTFNDVQFSIKDAESARTRTREAAIRDAVAKARTYVEGAGFRLGQLLLVEEGGSSMIAQSGNRARFVQNTPTVSAENYVAPPPVAPEPQLYTAEVTVVFRIEGPRAAN